MRHAAASNRLSVFEMARGRVLLLWKAWVPSAVVMVGFWGETDEDGLVEDGVMLCCVVFGVDGSEGGPENVDGTFARLLPCCVRDPVWPRSRSFGEPNGPDQIFFPRGPILWVGFTRRAILVGYLEPVFGVLVVGVFVVECARPVVV